MKLGKRNAPIGHYKYELFTEVMKTLLFAQIVAF